MTLYHSLVDPLIEMMLRIKCMGRPPPRDNTHLSPLQWSFRWDCNKTVRQSWSHHTGVSESLRFLTRRGPSGHSAKTEIKRKYDENGTELPSLKDLKAVNEHPYPKGNMRRRIPKRARGLSRVAAPEKQDCEFGSIDCRRAEKIAVINNQRMVAMEIPLCLCWLSPPLPTRPDDTPPPRIPGWTSSRFM